MRDTFSITGIAVLALFAAEAAAPQVAHAAPKPPTPLCVVWTNTLDAGDRWDINLIVRPLPGKVPLHFNGTPRLLRFWSLNGMVSAGLGTNFTAVTGTGYGYTDSPFLRLSLTAGRTELQGWFDTSSQSGSLARTKPDGTVAGGTFSLQRCSDVQIDD